MDRIVDLDFDLIFLMCRLAGVSAAEYRRRLGHGGHVRLRGVRTEPGRFPVPHKPTRANIWSRLMAMILQDVSECVRSNGTSEVAQTRGAGVYKKAHRDTT